MASSSRRDRTEAARPHPRALFRRATVRGVRGLVALLATSGDGRARARGAAVPAGVRAWGNAQNAPDPAARAALHASDGVLEDAPNRSVAPAAAIEGFVAGVLRSVGEIRGALRHAFGGDGWAVAEDDVAAPNRGVIPVPGTGGERFASRPVTVFKLDGEPIRRSSDPYSYDVASIPARLGAMPGAAAPSAATPAR